MPEYIILIGLPGSGKSTWIKKFLAKANEPYTIISSDNIIEELGGPEGLNYSEAFSKYSGFAMKEMNRRFAAAVQNNQNIIHDQTNMNVKTRRGKLAKVPDSYDKKAVVFSIPDPELKRRLKNRESETGKHIPNHAINSMAASYEAPSKAEGFSDIKYVRS